MSPRAAEEGKKCIFTYKERNINDDAGRVFETPVVEYGSLQARPMVPMTALIKGRP